MKTPSQSKRILRIPTLRLILASFALVLIAIALDESKRPLYAELKFAAHFMDYSALVLGWIGLLGLAAGVVFGPFRPIDQFNLRGLCQKRAINFSVSAAGLVCVTFYRAVRIASMI